MTSSAAEIDSVRRAWRDRLLCALVPHAVHRLGNLLTVVSGTAELLALESAGVDDKERATGLGNITAQSARAHAMIRALGHHARTLRGAPAAIDLHELVQSQYELLAPVSKAVGLPLEVLPSNGMTVARADSGGVQLAVTGLVVELLRPELLTQSRAGRTTLRAVGLGTRSVIVLRAEVEDGEPLEVQPLSAEAREVSATLGASLRQRVLPDGRGACITLGLPSLT